MKTRYTLFCWLSSLFFSPLFAQTIKPAVLNVRNGAVFEKLMVDIEPAKLLKLYGPVWHTKQVSRNRHEPAVRDSLLVATTAADHLELFKNKYNSFLTKADITSKKVVFGQGIKVGISRNTFCKVLGLSPKYTIYQVTDAPEEAVQLSFVFTNGLLAHINYKMLRPFNEID